MKYNFQVVTWNPFASTGITARLAIWPEIRNRMAGETYWAPFQYLCGSLGPSPPI